MDENEKLAGMPTAEGDIITGAKETIRQIYEQIGMVENCQAILPKLTGADVVLMLPDGSTAGLEGILDEKQRAGTLSHVRGLVEENIRAASERLAKLSGAMPLECAQGECGEPGADGFGSGTSQKQSRGGKPETPEDNMQDKTENGDGAGQKPGDTGKSVGETRRSRMELAEVRQMLKDGYSVEDIQKHYGYKTKQTVENFLLKNKVNVKLYGNSQYKEVTAADDGTIQALYTSGRFSLRETAAELGTSKKLLYEYIRKNPKLIPAKER